MELQAKRSFPAASWSNKFDVLRMTDRAREIVESIVDSGAAKSAWPIRTVTSASPTTGKRKGNTKKKINALKLLSFKNCLTLIQKVVHVLLSTILNFYGRGDTVRQGPRTMFPWLLTAPCLLVSHSLLKRVIATIFSPSFLYFLKKKTGSFSIHECSIKTERRKQCHRALQNNAHQESRALEKTINRQTNGQKNR